MTPLTHTRSVPAYPARVISLALRGCSPWLASVGRGFFMRLDHFRSMRAIRQKKNPPDCVSKTACRARCLPSREAYGLRVLLEVHL